MQARSNNGSDYRWSSMVKTSFLHKTFIKYIIIVSLSLYLTRYKIFTRNWQKFYLQDFDIYTYVNTL